MDNLAGHEDPDHRLLGELVSVGIEPVKADKKSDREVSTRITGRLGPFVFTRAWAYWTVKGPMPIAGAWEMYENPIGREYVRVAGHCGCPAPEGGYVCHLDENGKRVGLLTPEDQVRYLSYKEGKLDRMMTWAFGEMEKEGPLVSTSEERERLTVRRVVTSYHIDTLDGLRLFADTVRKFGLA